MWKPSPCPCLSVEVCHFLLAKVQGSVFQASVTDWYYDSNGLDDNDWYYQCPQSDSDGPGQLARTGSETAAITPGNTSLAGESSESEVAKHMEEHRAEMFAAAIEGVLYSAREDFQSSVTVSLADVLNGSEILQTAAGEFGLDAEGTNDSLFDMLGQAMASETVGE